MAELEAPGGGGEEDLAGYLQLVVEDQFRAHPALARANGDHTEDGEIVEAGEPAQRRRIEELQQLRARRPNSDGLDREARLDWDLAQTIVDSELFSLQVRRRAFTDPTVLLDDESPLDVGGYLLRDYAPLAERALGVCRQLEASRDWVEEALRTLEPELAKPLIELALQGADGQLTFLEHDVARVGRELSDERLRHRLEAGIEVGRAALHRIQQELRRRGGDGVRQVAMGEERLLEMLFVEEGLRRSLQQLLAEADHELESLSEERDQVLRDHYRGRSAREGRQVLERDHFTASTLIQGAEGLLGELRQFVERQAEVPIPDGPPCEVRPSPGFLTAWVSAAYEGTGPLERLPLPSLYFVTTPQPSWSPEEAEEWLRYLNRATLKNTSVHEVYPGHHVHHLYTLRSKSDLRRFFWTSGFGEGWAHYTEQLTIERGLAEGDPALHLAQLEDALLRACRFRTTIGIHAQGWEVGQGTELFMERVGVEELPAHREAMRATFDPLYLVYTLGKREILRWRERWLSSGRGDLRSFHERVLSAGSPPLAALERYLYSD